MTTLKPRTATVYLYQGDDVARIAELKDAVDNAIGLYGLKVDRREDDETRRIGDATTAADDVDPVREAVREHDEFVAAARERATKVTMQYLGWRRWRKLVEAHPPRDDDQDDAAVGYNQDTMAPELLMFVDAEAEPDDPGARTIVEPEFRSRKALEAFIDSLSEGEFNRLYSNAYMLNTGYVPDPKGDLSSKLDRILNGISSSPSPSD